MKLQAKARLVATEDAALKKLISGKSVKELQELVAQISAVARAALLGPNA